jgi:predicted N-formylglutamate amidohydrolase
VHNAGATSPFLLVGDHAGNRIPGSLGRLGLDDAELQRHIAWDIGIAELGLLLGDSLAASFIHQIYSRLVIDCNRRTGAPDSIPAVSDGTPIAGNAGLASADGDARAAAIHAPYHQAIADEIDRRTSLGLPTVLVALHSFTPAMNGVDRPWHVGILYDAGDIRFARATMAAFAQNPALIVGDNEPYSMDTIDFTIPTHAYPRGLPYVELEIRQDLLAHSEGVKAWSHHVEQALTTARGYTENTKAGNRE